VRIGAILLAIAQLAAHKFHFSRTEIDYHPPRLEIVVTLHAGELPFPAESEKAACAYVLANFAIKNTPLRCVGAKSSVHYLDVFLEGDAPAPPAAARNQILRKEFPDQRNSVLLRREARPIGKAIEFGGADEWKPLIWRP